MPWTSNDAERHTHKATTTELKELWAKVGGGRVREWVAKHGDPRDPKIDAVDWVERIPLAETRNYVQRVMENLQGLGRRTLLGASVATVEPNPHRVTTIELLAKPTFVDAIPK